MKAKIWSILVACIFVLVVSSTGLYAQEDILFRGEGYEVLTTIAIPRYTYGKLRTIFTERCTKLSVWFNNEKPDLEGIADYYGPTGWIITHNNELKIGKEAILGYLQELKKDRAVLIDKKFECLEVIIDYDRILALRPSKTPDYDPLYPLRENIKIHIQIPNGSDHQLDSVAMTIHQRRTFERD